MLPAGGGDRKNVVIKNNYIDTQEGQPQASIGASGIIFYNLGTLGNPLSINSVDGAVVQDNYIYQTHTTDGENSIWLQDVDGAVTIAGNTVQNSDPQCGAGVCMGGSGVYGGNLDFSGTVIEDNVVTYPSPITGGGSAMRLKRLISPTTPFSITGNTLTGAKHGIYLQGGCSSSTDIVAHFNNLAGNSWGIRSKVNSTTIDATDNWWGTINGPEHSGNTYNVGSQGPRASDYVTYVPWWDSYPGGSSWGPVENPSASYYSSIQAAVDAASSGHTITCTAGTYNETGTFLDHAGLHFVSSKGGITLSGANAGAPGYDGTRGAESIIEGPNVLHGNAIYIFDGADGVVIDGFTLKAGDDIVENRADDVVIKNNVITPVSGILADPNAPGIFACEANNLTVAYNWVRDTGGIGMFLGLAAFSADINGLVEHNLIEDAGAAGILVNYSTGGLVIERNTIGDAGHDGIRGGPSAQGITIEHNEIYGSARDGVRIIGSAASHYINYNSIYSSVAYGVRNLDAAKVDASCNWWGTNDPTGVAGEVSAYVDYTPWLDTGTDTEPGTPGFQGDFSTLWVDDDSPQTGAPGRIQEGVDLVTGSTVNVVDGTYTEQVYITKSLALEGVTSPSKPVISAPAAASRTTYSIAESGRLWDPLVFADGGTGTIAVTVKGFEIDGLGDDPGPSPRSFAGVLFRNIDPGLIQHNDVHGFTGGWSQGGSGIDVYGISDVTIDGCSVYDYTKTGIVVNGDNGALADPNATIIGNTVTGRGPITDTAQNGIQIGFGAGGSITGNTVTGCSYTGGYWAASGILPYMTSGTVQINGNTIRENQINVYLADCSASLDGNTVYATATGTGQTYFYGIIGDPGETKAPKPSPFGSGGQATGGATITYTVTCTNNTVESDGSSGGTGIGIYAGMYGTYDIDFTATGNTVRYWQWGFELYEYAPSNLISAEIHYNIIEGNTSYGILNYLTTTCNAEANWWGHKSGPYHGTTNPDGVGNAVSDNVDYSPWLGATPGTSPMTWHTDDSVQDAVDAATSGDEIIVHPGQYNECVVIGTNNLTLKGGWEDNSDIEHAEMNGDGLGYADAFRIQAHHITVKGFEMHNYGGKRGSGVQAWNDNSDYCTIESNWIHDNYWNAVLVGNEGTTVHTGWLIKDNVVSGHGFYSIEITNGKDCKIEGNRIMGGYTGILVQARKTFPSTMTSSGIKVEDNEISGTTGIGMYIISLASEPLPPFGPVVGAWALLKDVKIEGNNVHDNGQFGIYLWGYLEGVLQDAEVEKNTVTGNGPYHGMVLNNTDESKVSENEVTGSGMDGIALYGGSAENRISENTVETSGRWGISLRGDASENRVEENEVSGSGLGCDLHWDGFGSDNCWEDNEGIECPDPLPGCDEDVGHHAIQIAGRERAPLVFALSQNNPNPFSRETAISYMLPASGHTILKIYDVSGRVVEILVDEELTPGIYSVNWDRNDTASGTYFYRLSSNGKTLTKKMTVVR